ncbi:MAG TPA: class I SAM-dependent methyltransferase [Verrucomicrobiae bacterium]|nr:class I SAM-dependent methyltransferase [Verrucomicrobiae bacterium]
MIALVGLGNLVLAVFTRSIGPFVGGLFPLMVVAIAVHTSRRGKFLVWRDVLDGLRLTGNERVLDLGCGRGAVLMAAADRLTGGRAVGVDIWRRVDQSGNAADATRANARIENVADRVLLVTGDMTALPFDSGSFDLITSNVAIHNIKGADGRRRALEEAVRVLRPGGRLALADLRDTDRQVKRLAALGMLDVERHNLGWRMWWGGPWAPTRLVTATKPVVKHSGA